MPRVAPRVASPAPIHCRPPGRQLQALSFARREFVLDGSLITQIDGLLHAVFRLRLERDVCCSSSADSFCPVFGASFSPASTFCGLYMPSPDLLMRVVGAVRTERGYGVFVGPASLCRDLTPASPHLLFSFVGPSASPWCGVLISFAFAGKLRRRRPETTFQISPIRDAPLQVAMLPFCPARVSPLAAQVSPSVDTVPPSPSLPVFQGPVAFNPAPGAWNSAKISMWAGLYPFADVAALARSATSQDGLPLSFAGDRGKCVMRKNLPLSPAVLEKVRENCVKEVKLGRMAGPFARCPYPNESCTSQARVVPVGAVPKDKWDPVSERVRVISNLSVCEPSSVNDLVYTPKLLAFHCQASHVRDVLAFLGPTPQMSGIDHHDAFRTSRTNVVDLHLFCYHIPPDWFVDLCNCFGCVTFEWSYGCIGAILHWCLLRMGVAPPGSWLFRYVDNWYLFSRADDRSHPVRWAKLKSFLTAVGCVLHEEQHGPKIDALGWEWCPGVFQCPADKFGVQMGRLLEWDQRAAAGNRFVVREIEQVVGLLQWTSAACPVILPCCGVLRKAIARFAGAPTRATSPSLVLSTEATSAVSLLLATLSTWDRKRVLFLGYTPMSLAEVVVRTDASTEFGAGGFAWPSFSGFIHRWTSAERVTSRRSSEACERESTTYFELRAIQIMLAVFGQKWKGLRVQFESDSQTSVQALRKCFSDRPRCQKVIRDIIVMCVSLHIIPRWEHISACFNPIADSLSHNRLCQAQAHCVAEFGEALVLRYCRQ